MNRSLASLAALATAALTSLPALAQDTTAPRPPPPVEQLKNAPTQAEQQFVSDAAKDGIAEVRIGQLAAQKGMSDAVKDLGKHLADDHSKANDQLKQIAQSSGIPVPTDVDEKQQKEITKLQKLSGASFDKEFASFMVKDHKAAIDRFEKASKDKDIKDPSLKGFATGTVVALQHHLDMARGVNEQVKKEK